MKSVHRRGFTLLEVLLAVALAGALLVALNLFVFSMAEIWGRGGDERLFRQHARAVTRHVESLLRRASLPGIAGPGNHSAIWIEEIRTDTAARDSALSFELPAGDRLLAWPEHPLPDAICALVASPRVGLKLYWYSRLELREPDDPRHAILVSPFVSGLTYHYYQTETHDWQDRRQLQRKADGQWLRPDAITLHFERGNLHEDALIVLPEHNGGGPNS